MEVYHVSFVNRGGVIPWIDPKNNEARVPRKRIEEMANNPEVLNREGITGLRIASYPGYWHIFQAGGYTPSEGIFCDMY